MEIRGSKFFRSIFGFGSAEDKPIEATVTPSGQKAQAHFEKAQATQPQAQPPTSEESILVPPIAPTTEGEAAQSPQVPPAPEGEKPTTV